MARFNFSAKIRIGAKLGLSLGLGVVMVAGMIAGEQLNSNFVEALVAAADKQQAIVNESTNTQVLMQKALIAGRDLNSARTQLEQLVKSLPGDPVVKFLNGRVEELTGNRPVALKLYTDALNAGLLDLPVEMNRVPRTHRRSDGDRRRKRAGDATVGGQRAVVKARIARSPPGGLLHHVVLGERIDLAWGWCRCGCGSAAFG